MAPPESAQPEKAKPGYKQAKPYSNMFADVCMPDVHTRRNTLTSFEVAIDTLQYMYPPHTLTN